MRGERVLQEGGEIDGVGVAFQGPRLLHLFWVETSRHGMRPILQKRLGTQQLEIDQAVERPWRLEGRSLSNLLEPCFQPREMIVLWPESVTVCSRQHREEDLHTREGTVLMNPGGLIGALGIETGEDIARLQPGVSPGAHGWHACWVQALV